MRGIEPELLTANLPHLDAAYARETAEEHSMRMERYRQAYAAFDDALQQMSSYMFTYVQQSKKGAVRQRAAKEQTQASADVEAVDHLLQTFSFDL